MQAREMTSNAHEMEIGITKKRKVQHDMKQQSLLFGELPDEMVMNILSYGDMDDIENTRAWQSKKVQHFTESICKEKAAEKNNLDNMKWIYEDIGDTEFYFDDEKFTCTEWAAENGNILMLSWLKLKECPWGVCTFASAAGAGAKSLQVMKWLKVQECPWDEDTFSYAFAQGDLEVLNWLKDNDCPGKEIYEKMYSPL